MAPGASIHFRDAMGEIRKGRFLSADDRRAIVEFDSGAGIGIDRCTCVPLGEIIDEAEEKRRRKLAAIDARQQAEVQRHQAELRLIAREREAL